MTSHLKRLLESEDPMPLQEAKQEAPSEPQEAQGGAGGRMTTAQVLLHMQRLQGALERAGQAYQKLPDASPKEVPELLAAIQEQATAAAEVARKLAEANK